MSAAISSFGYLALYLLHIVLTPLFLIGLVRKGKAFLQGRQGPALLQPFRDVAKRMHKGETISSGTTWVFRWAPLIGLASTLAAALMTPWLGVRSPMAGDVLLLVYVLALGKFSTGLAALDSGSSFGAFAASREAGVSLQTEPAMLLALIALAAHVHSSALSALFVSVRPGPHIIVLAMVVVFALWISAMAELSRMPIDDPATHLELTMIHEALILEYSGPRLALIEYSVALRTVLLLGLVAQVALLAVPPVAPIIRYASTMALIVIGAGVIVVAESVLVKLRWRRIPNLLSFALSASVLACLLIAVRG